MRDSVSKSVTTREQHSLRCEIFVSATNLTDLDVFTLSDPICMLKMRQGNNLGYTHVGQTEVIDNNLNPKWVKNFSIDYIFGMQ